MTLSTGRKDLLFLFVVLLLALTLRVYHLGALSLWSDEAFTNFYADNSLSYLWGTGFRLEFNPPGFYTLMHFWVQLFGHSECTLRFPSVLASLVTSVLVYALGKELANSAIGLIGALFIALAPTEIWYAQEARAYALLQMAIAVALLGMARYLSPSRSVAGLFVYALAAIVAAYLHATGILFIAACNLSALLLVLYDRSLMTRPSVIAWLAANALIALTLVPLFINIDFQSHTATMSWIAPLSLNSLVWSVKDVLSGPAATREFAHGHFLWYLLILTMVFVLVRFRTLDRRSLTILVLPALFFTALVLLASLHTSIFVSRLFFWTWVPLSLLLAHAVFYGGKVRPFICTIAFLALAFGLTAQLFPSPSPKENWRKFLQQNHDQLSNADTVIVIRPISMSPIAYYMPELATHLACWQLDHPLFPTGSTEVFYFKSFHAPKIDTMEVLEKIRSGKKVCLLVANSSLSSLSSSFASLPPPTYQSDDVYPGGVLYQLHLLTWEGR